MSHANAEVKRSLLKIFRWVSASDDEQCINDIIENKQKEEIYTRYSPQEWLHLAEEKERVMSNI